MTDDNERGGELIYREGKVEVRTFPKDFECHNVWIGEHYFLLQRDCLKQFAMKTLTGELERSLANYNQSIPSALKQESVPPETFALILSRARIEELEAQVNDAYSQIHSLEDKIKEK